MHCIQNSWIGTPSPCAKAIVGFTGVLAITVIALSIIGLTASPSGPFNTIVQFGATTHQALLGTSIFAIILDLVWSAALCKKTKKERFVLRSAPSRLGLPKNESCIRSTPLDPPTKCLKYAPSQSALVSVREEINDTDSFSQQPKDIILKIFGYLNIIELTKCGEVSRRWRRFTSDVTLWNAFDLRKISPLLKIFDESDWNAYVDLPSFGLNVTDAPPLDKHQAITFLKRCLASLQIEENAGVTLLTIPRGLTLNKLIHLARVPKMGGNIAQFRAIWDRVSNEMGDIPVDKTYRIVITNNVFMKSRSLSVSDQKTFVKRLGCEMPKTLEAALLLVVTFMVSGQRLYDGKTYTRCSEQFLIQDNSWISLHEDNPRNCRSEKQFSKYQSVVGGFVSNGIRIYNYDNYGNALHGVGGVMRKSKDLTI